MCWFKKKKEKEVSPYYSKGVSDMEIDNILIDLFKEFGIEGLQVGYKVLNHKLIIYTNRPGLIIGYHGNNHQRIKEELKRSFCNIEDVVYETIENILPLTKWTEEEIEHERDLLMRDLMNGTL